MEWGLKRIVLEGCILFISIRSWWIKLCSSSAVSIPVYLIISDEINFWPAPLTESISFALGKLMLAALIPSVAIVAVTFGWFARSLLVVCLCLQFSFRGYRCGVFVLGIPVKCCLGEFLCYLRSVRRTLLRYRGCISW